MSARNNIAIGLAAATALVGVTTILGSWFTVDQGDRGVVLRNGAFLRVAEPGLGFKAPWVDDVVEISVQEHVSTYGSEQTGTGLASYSRDQQPAVIRVSVNWRIPADRVREVYQDYGGSAGLISRILDPRVQQTVKNVFGSYNAVTAIQDRSRLNADTLTALQAAIGGLPIAVNGLQIENIDFSDAYEQSVEERMLAEVEVAKLRQNAEREKVQAEITVTKANAEADATRAKATADADAIRIKGEAEADAISKRGAALRDNPAMIDLVKAERWNGILPATMVPGSAVPFIEIGGSQ